MNRVFDPKTNKTSMQQGSGGAAFVCGAPRTCVGRQTIANLSTSTPATLTVPTDAVAAMIQADGGGLRITQEGTNPTSTIGSRIDDGVFYYVDTPLASVKMLAMSAGVNVQVAYFDKA